MKRLLALLLCTAAARVATAAVPVFITHQGRLLDSSDAPVNGTHNFTFTLYTHPTPASDGSYEDTSVWTETDPNVAVTNGVYAVQLGQASALDASKLTGRLYLQVAVDGTALQPRMWVSSSVFALRAAVADEAGHAAKADAATEATHAAEADHALVADALASSAANGFLQLGTTPIAQAGSASLTGTLTAGSFAGDSALVTGVNAASLGGIAPSGYVQLSDSPAAQAGSIHVAGTVSAGAFAGNGAGLTNVNAATLGGLDKSAFQPAGNYQPAGTYQPAGSYLNVVTNPTAQTGSSTITGTMTAGKFVGDGSGLAGVNAATLGGKPASGFLTSGSPIPLPTGTIASPPYTCNSGNAGTMFFDTGTKSFYGCDGTSFQPLNQLGGAPGSTAQLAVSSCKALHATSPNAPSGIYWMTLDGTPANTLQVYCDMTSDGGGWTMVYKLNAGGGFGGQSDANTLWNYAAAGNNVGETNAALLTTSKTTGAYANHFIKSWNGALGAAEVRVNVYNAGNVVKYMRYNGAGSTATNWYAQSRIVASSWTDLTTSVGVNYWSIPGDSGIGRNWFINANYGGCPSDNGWLVVMSGAGGGCGWEQTNSAVPRFLYAPNSTVANWTTGQALAEAFAVFVR